MNITNELPLWVLCHVPHEHLGRWATTLSRAGVGYQYVDCATANLRALDLSATCGLMVMGGPMNVDETDRYPWLADEDRLLREALSRGLPILGVCLGAQLIAKSLGAPVTRSPAGPEIGWYPLRLAPAARADPLFRHFADGEVVFHWHGDTYARPPGAVHLAASDLCAEQAFRHGHNVYGLQFHVEVTAGMIDQWLEAGAGELAALGGATRARAIAAQSAQYAERMGRLADEVGRAFVRLAIEKTKPGV